MRTYTVLLAVVASFAFALGTPTNVPPTDSTKTKSPTPTIHHAPATQQEIPTEKGHALLIAIPLPGHVNPLMSQALELHRRGWRVTMASPSRMARHIAATNGNGAVEYMDLGDCAAIQELHDALERAADHENYMESAREMFHWAIHLHGCMYKQLYSQIPKLPVPVTLIIADFATYAGFDVADALGIPLVVNNPDLLNMLSPDDVVPYDFVPGTMTASSIRTVSGPDSGYGLVARVVYPPLRIFIRWLGELTAGKELNQEQESVGLTPTSLFGRLSGKLILVNNAFGLEWSRPVPPNVVLVGPMLEKKWQSSVSLARKEYRSALSPEDEQWLSWRTPEGKSLPVIWVSMGTIAPLNMRQVVEMFLAFSSGVKEDRFRVLWKLDPSDHGFLPAEMPDANRLRVTTWVSSQLGVLAHDATQIFLSHCGINSVHESVYLRTKLLCIPILADQADMAARVEDAHVGTHLSKSTFTAATLGDTLDSLLAAENQPKYTQGLSRARAAMSLAGGVERAVDFIEFAASHGASALIPIDVHHPWYVRSNYDVLLVHLLLVFLLYRIFHCLCCTHRPGRECIDDRRKIRQKSQSSTTATVAASSTIPSNRHDDTNRRKKE